MFNQHSITYLMILIAYGVYIYNYLKKKEKISDDIVGTILRVTPFVIGLIDFIKLQIENLCRNISTEQKELLSYFKDTDINSILDESLERNSDSDIKFLNKFCELTSAISENIKKIQEKQKKEEEKKATDSKKKKGIKKKKQ